MMSRIGAIERHSNGAIRWNAAQPWAVTGGAFSRKPNVTRPLGC
jgi:hypothetical protein